jgi:opacity protein-like surface antigen
MRVSVWAVVLCLPLGASAVAAQDAPPAEASLGYSYLRSSDESFHGIDGSLTFNLGRLFGIEADVAYHRATIEGVDAAFFSYMAGPRLSWRRSGLVPFLHALIGGVKTTESISVLGVTVSQHETDLGSLVGAGLDFPRGRWGLRLQGGYQLVRSHGETNGDPRFGLGVLLKLGGR